MAHAGLLSQYSSGYACDDCELCESGLCQCQIAIIAYSQLLDAQAGLEEVTMLGCDSPYCPFDRYGGLDILGGGSQSL